MNYFSFNLERHLLRDGIRGVSAASIYIYIYISTYMCVHTDYIATATARIRGISDLTRNACDLQRDLHLPHCSRCTALERVLHSPTATPNSHDTVYVTLTAPFLRFSFYVTL